MAGKSPKKRSKHTERFARLIADGKVPFNPYTGKPFSLEELARFPMKQASFLADNMPLNTTKGDVAEPQRGSPKNVGNPSPVFSDRPGLAMPSILEIFIRKKTENGTIRINPFTKAPYCMGDLACFPRHVLLYLVAGLKELPTPPPSVQLLPKKQGVACN